MNRRERLMATLNGESVDRPAVSFYEINGMDELKNSQDPWNIYTHPTWLPLIELAREKTDRIVMRTVPFSSVEPDPIEAFTGKESWMEGDSLYSKVSIQMHDHVLSETTRRDKDVNTTWHIEHLLKDVEDIKVWLELPRLSVIGEPDASGVISTEFELGDSGIVMIDTPDPLCEVASLFDLGTFTVLALTETYWLHRMLEVIAERLFRQTEAVAKKLPGRLWRIYGPEYASPPYLPPKLFRELVVKYDTYMVQTIQKYGGYARLHSHGKLRAILDDIASTGCVGLDPIEPPPQGDVELSYVRERYGKQLVLFGNLEASDLENLNEDEFEKKIREAITQGTAGEGRGFVLMPSSCPYGRILSVQSYRNYQKMIEIIEHG